jgi:hypothetical protein
VVARDRPVNAHAAAIDTCTAPQPDERGVHHLDGRGGFFSSALS